MKWQVISKNDAKLYFTSTFIYNYTCTFNKINYSLLKVFSKLKIQTVDSVDSENPQNSTLPL